MVGRFDGFEKVHRFRLAVKFYREMSYMPFQAVRFQQNVLIQNEFDNPAIESGENEVETLMSRPVCLC